MRTVRLLVGVVALAALAGPPEAESCGPFLPAAQFSYISQPPMNPFTRGELGILRPLYFRKYLVVAYRYLNGAPLNAEERTALAQMESRKEAAPGHRVPAGVDRWLAALNRVPGVSAPQSIPQNRRLAPPNNYQFYPNCLEDAFDHAAATLGERQKRWGAASPLVVEWVRGQDAVFQNCEEGATIPARLPAGSDAILRADRQYQIAAAEFYSEQYAAAKRDFDAIAADAGSEWREPARLAAARTLLREATVLGDNTKLPLAAIELTALANDAQQPEWRAAARKLLGYVEARQAPLERMAQAAEQLSKPRSGAEFTQALTDFTALWDRQNRGPTDRSDLADWITTFQKRDWQHAVTRWREKGGDAWLVAALAGVPANDPVAGDLVAAAHRVAATAPAWASATYYGINIEIRVDVNTARTWADQALAAKPPAAVRNEILAERLQLARDWQEFLRFAPREAVAANVIVPDEAISTYGRTIPKRGPMLAQDSAETINREVPLVRWVDAAANPLLPAELQADVAQAGWVRALLLGRSDEAHRLAPRLAQLRPQWKAPLTAWLATKDEPAAQFEAAMFLLRNPGLTPVLRDGFGRLSEDHLLDNYRDNWWNFTRLLPISAAPATFLPEAERTAGEAEWKQLREATPEAPVYLAGIVMTWARSHASDARVPEALHLVVRSTRFTDRGPNPSKVSREAFTLLHQRYPKSEWTAQTPYWY